MIRNTDEYWSDVNPVHLVNPVYIGFMLMSDEVEILDKTLVH